MKQIKFLKKQTERSLFAKPRNETFERIKTQQKIYKGPSYDNCEYLYYVHLTKQ